MRSSFKDAMERTMPQANTMIEKLLQERLASGIYQCSICKKDCVTMAGLIVHVRKFHPNPNTLTCGEHIESEATK